MTKKLYVIPTARYIMADYEEMMAGSPWGSEGEGGYEEGEISDPSAKGGFAPDFSDDEE